MQREQQKHEQQQQPAFSSLEQGVHCFCDWLRLVCLSCVCVVNFLVGLFLFTASSLYLVLFVFCFLEGKSAEMVRQMNIIITIQIRQTIVYLLVCRWSSCRTPKTTTSTILINYYWPVCAKRISCSRTLASRWIRMPSCKTNSASYSK